MHLISLGILVSTYGLYFLLRRIHRAEPLGSPASEVLVQSRKLNNVYMEAC